MGKSETPVIVIGHKNPDTDSICSAVCYARFKSEVMGEPAKPFRAGNVNPQTSFVLSRFETETPPLVTDLYPRIEDIMIPRQALITLSPQDTVEMAGELLTRHRFSFIPVEDAENKCLGVISVLRIAEIFRDLAREKTDSKLAKALKNAVSSPIGEYVDRGYPSFERGEQVKEVLRHIRERNEGGFLIRDGEGRLVGVITRVSFLSESRQRVILVDHNEVSQAVDGIEEAEITEIIDHHRLGNRSTRDPVTFINRTLGSTASIIADLYKNAGVEPPRRDAGLLLSALLSDTVILKSPTTTPLDIEIASRLARISGLDMEKYGEEMFAAGAAIEGVSAEDIIAQDQKPYEEAGVRFAVSQIETVGFHGVMERKTEFLEELARTVKRDSLAFACLLATDITRETSLCFFSGDKRIQSLVSYPAKEEGIFEMKGVLSRKKQILPYFIDLIRRL